MNKNIFSFLKMFLVFSCGLLISCLVIFNEFIPAIFISIGFGVWGYVFYKYQKDIERLLKIIDKHSLLMENIKKYFGYQDDSNTVEINNIKNNILAQLVLLDMQGSIQKELTFEINGIKYIATIKTKRDNYEK